VNDVDDRRIERVEQLLRSAGPAPQLPPSLAEPPRVDEPARERKRERPSARKSWLAVGFATAAAAAAIAFTVGYALGDRGEGLEPVAEIAMRGVAPAAAASAELDVGEPDADGNVPIEMSVRGLPALPPGGWYDLLLSKGGRPTVSCGTFNAGPGTTTVLFNVGYALREWRDEGRYDGWVVTSHVPGTPVSANRILLTT
jgi:hypothetical protein